ncbi:MAG: Asp-tRNA(Asn)/Glu-tRNA(Gln) amidotransferase subunit GatC [Nitrospinaceae bacterium]|nr:Asp-tRNA(Asn)/Glu-tRNA(Gln) amidotransferase subunit GatC [Nitrospinaceae bacterium]NIR56498.1 Asp-tRNA(Asn)/Glu-tRNA(Gln) amidotransferase subunit GatC [Nitrospinaceae bacterium]NIS86956.1 Asp-tRNA(Asn)/Glu-tRNA(Gln) amidotransferase subunit GatC [Nitrospinaceae bacterium]NIT83800.1 Asp-tRNA(Asn)/Glu-tRNA(Gln) amidotransferase subunit GatC [Nitrospinaceae bacterium]NIU46006.1 Asp-tRNA(Asn)/Glu-tRNA(Gln) amidotransferase subunit GatC [Nitrospinaceae bacterium]
MSSDSFDIEKIALLARMKLTDDEKSRLGSQFAQIMRHINQLNQLETDQVEPTSHVLPLHNVFREDEVKETFPGGPFLPLAPRQDKGHYEVPQII